MSAYAGIGSRQTPPQILDLMTALARKLAQTGYTLRSGHAPGADQAFERGAGQDAEIYLPWASFERAVCCSAGYTQPAPSPEALQLAGQHHPAWDRLKPAVRSLHARNCHQILGRDLSDPVAFVVCWTPDGATTSPGPSTGGTGQALRLANANSIPVFNLARLEHLTRVESFISTTP